MSPAVLEQAIDRDPAACRALLRAILPVIRRRVRRALGRCAHWRGGSGEDAEDLVQEVLMALFDDDARILRAWDPARGASITTFIGIVADRRIASILRSARRRPWGAELPGESHVEGAASALALPDARVASREFGKQLLDRLGAELSPMGQDLFESILVDEKPVATICSERGMSAQAVWAWRHRLKKVIARVGGELESRPPPPQLEVRSAG